MTTNYEKYFGTPERAAEAMDDWAKCDGCPVNLQCVKDDLSCEDAYFTWLMEEADE